MNVIFRSLSRRAFSSQLNKEKWDVYSAVCLERVPVINRDLTDLESEVAKTFARIDFEKSHLSDFEKRVKEDKVRDKKIKEGKMTILEMDTAPQQTAQDFLDAGVEELRAFKFADRVKKGDDKSTDKELDRRLLLLIQDKIGEKPHWILPHGKYSNEKSLRETAERVLKEKLGENINARFLGNAPAGFYKFKYPKSIQNGTIGAKIFFFKAQLLNGKVDDKLCPNYNWATRKQMDKLHPDYKKSVDLFLIDEEH